MNRKSLFAMLVAFSFLLAGCAGNGGGASAPPSEFSTGTPAHAQEPSGPVAEEEVAIAPSEPGEPPEIMEVPGEEVPEIPEPSTEPEPQETASPEAEELAQLFDIEINEPPEDFEYGSAPGE